MERRTLFCLRSVVRVRRAHKKERITRRAGHAGSLRFERAQPIDSRVSRPLSGFFQHHISIERREFQWNF